MVDVTALLVAPTSSARRSSPTGAWRFLDTTGSALPWPLTLALRSLPWRMCGYSLRCCGPPTIRDFMIFEEHATQQGSREREEAWYRMPIFYFSNPLCVYGPEDEIPFPSSVGDAGL